MNQPSGAHEYNELTLDQKADVHWLYHESPGSFNDCITAFIDNGFDKEKALKSLKEA